VSQKTLNRDGKKKKDHFKRWNVKWDFPIFLPS
jgi:hypothetical protein